MMDNFPDDQHGALPANCSNGHKEAQAEGDMKRRIRYASVIFWSMVVIAIIVIGVAVGVSNKGNDNEEVEEGLGTPSLRPTTTQEFRSSQSPTLTPSSQSPTLTPTGGLLPTIQPSCNVAVLGEFQQFFGEDRNSCEFTNRVYADAARDDFLSSIGYSAATFGFESLPVDTPTPFEVELGDVTAKFIGEDGVKGLGVVADEVINNNFFCVVSGDKAFFRDAQSPNSNPAFRIDFSKPIFAFGFYAAHVGSVLWIETSDSEGNVIKKLEVPRTPNGQSKCNQRIISFGRLHRDLLMTYFATLTIYPRHKDGHIFFYGIMDEERPFKFVRFIINSWADGWLIDDITISWREC